MNTNTTNDNIKTSISIEDKIKRIEEFVCLY